MKLPLSVKSNYYKGLLVLSRRDRLIDDRERKLLIQIGEMLGFDGRFCEATIDELLSNTHISRDPIVFSEEAIKDCFFRDALRVAYSDGCLHPMELRWLQQMAKANGKSDEWLDALIEEFQGNGNSRDHCSSLEIQEHL
jgi:hypothetical protein